MCPYCHKTKVINSEPREQNEAVNGNSSQYSSSSTSRLTLADQAVWGFTSIGSGHRNMEEVLSSMNVAPISEKSFRRSEELLGQVTSKISFLKI